MARVESMRVTSGVPMSKSQRPASDSRTLFAIASKDPPSSSHEIAAADFNRARVWLADRYGKALGERAPSEGTVEFIRA